MFARFSCFVASYFLIHVYRAAAAKAAAAPPSSSVAVVAETAAAKALFVLKFMMRSLMLAQHTFSILSFALLPSNWFFHSHFRMPEILSLCISLFLHITFCTHGKNKNHRSGVVLVNLIQMAVKSVAKNVRERGRTKKQKKKEK